MKNTLFLVICALAFTGNTFAMEIEKEPEEKTKYRISYLDFPYTTKALWGTIKPDNSVDIFDYVTRALVASIRCHSKDPSCGLSLKAKGNILTVSSPEKDLCHFIMRTELNIFEAPHFPVVVYSSMAFSNAMPGKLNMPLIRTLEGPEEKSQWYLTYLYLNHEAQRLHIELNEDSSELEIYDSFTKRKVASIKRITQEGRDAKSPDICCQIAKSVDSTTNVIYYKHNELFRVTLSKEGNSFSAPNDLQFVSSRESNGALLGETQLLLSPRTPLMFQNLREK